ncbi:hypothetical protein ACH3VR_21095 [Microbacterium sp. B2969]|uniref:Uncharacterized protein n=1 Tax=Microbacterium alkaliflavum TaxID=3248839 RepID=A0ABW7QDA8_9MICO
MEWTADVAAGGWIRDRLDDPWRGTMHDVVPHGFAAYARILHPRVSELSREREEGRIDPAVLSVVASHLAAHSGTPEIHVAVWDGWGGLVGGLGVPPTPAVARSSNADGEDSADPAVLERHREMLARSIHDPFNNVFRKHVWLPGILSDEISRGPRLVLPHREHVLFRGTIDELMDAAWAQRVPWAEPQAPQFTASPSLVWPDDRAWVLATDVDADATIVAGPPALIRTLSTDARIEADPIAEGTVLGPFADADGA